MIQNLLEEISQIIPKENILENESMDKHTTFRVGGPARLFIEINSIEELGKVVTLLENAKEDYYLVGNGSNLLVSDAGYSGVVLHLSKQFEGEAVKVADEDMLICSAGATLAMIASAAYNNSLTGFEFAAGIPGSLGGAVVMNAGAYGGEMKQVIEKVSLMDMSGNVIEKSCEEMKFSYRHSILKEEKYIVLGATIRLTKGNKEEIKATMDDLASKRREKQPLNYPSAGSTFKRPEGYFAAKLIDDAGFRGFQCGGAQVSEKHCGFVINKENATADDIVKLMSEVQEKVYGQFGVELEPEVILLGDF